MNKINADGNDIKHWKLDKLISGKKQVIAGLKYSLKFSMVRTECDKQVVFEFNCLLVELERENLEDEDFPFPKTIPVRFFSGIFRQNLPIFHSKYPKISIFFHQNHHFLPKIKIF